jgi:hypothetical protein
MKCLPWAILSLVLILAWMTLGLSGYAKRSAGKGDDSAEEKALKRHKVPVDAKKI